MELCTKHVQLSFSSSMAQKDDSLSICLDMIKDDSAFTLTQNNLVDLG